MLSKKNLLTREEFNTYFKTGKMVHGDLMMMKITQSDSIEKKFSCVVSKKVQKGAVRRHLLKRRVYNALDNNIEAIKKGVFGIIMMKKSDHFPTFVEIEKDIQKILRKIR